jgi:hypothetical protein
MRKGLLQEAVTGSYQRHGDVAEADCVIGFSFGYRSSKGHSTPGVSNRQLAVIIAEHYLELPLILQWEIAAGLPVEASRVWRIERHAKKHQYLDTREVARQARAIMQQQNYMTALVVAHPHHVGRVDAVCQRLGMHTVVPDGLDGVDFDARSRQPWTRRQPAWAVRETMAIAYYDVLGWL